MGHSNCYNQSMKIVISNSSHDAYFRVLEKMKAARAAGEKIYVIAPDRFTASVERGLLLTLGEASSFDIEVMSFTRMADRFIGSDIKKCLTPEGSVMLIARVIDDCLKAGQLSYYGKSASREGFASELYAALTAIRNSGISTEKLEETANAASSVALKRKLKDIVTIYRGYLAALEGKHSDSTTRLNLLAKYIKENPSAFKGIHFFSTDINDFSEPEYDILEGLAMSAGQLTLGIQSESETPNARIYPHRALKRLSARIPDRISIERYEDEDMPEAVKAISARLFSYRPPEKRVEAEGKVRIRCAKDREDEALRLALDILNHVRGGGRYKDFEVYIPNIADYEIELKSVFARYGIPFFIDKRALLTEQTKTRYLLDAIACVRSGFARRETLDFVKNPLFEEGLEDGRESVFQFENYMLEHALERCPGNEVFEDIDTKQRFKHAKCDDKALNLKTYPPEVVRKKLFETLSPLIGVAGVSGGKKADMSSLVSAARQILNDADDASETHVEQLAKLSSYYVKCAEQVDSKLSSVLDEIEDVLELETDLQGFEGVLNSMLKTLKISLVPTYLDCVFIGDGDSRFMGDGKIYVLGATNDAFPCITGGGAVLNMRDEEMMKALSAPIIPDCSEKAYAEMFKILDLIKKPRKGIVLSYPESGGTSLMRRSSVIDELMGMLSEDGKPLAIERIDFSSPAALSEEDSISLLLTERGAGYAAISYFGRAGSDDVLGTAYECMRDEDRAHMAPKSLPERVTLPEGVLPSSTSVSRLETFFACPYSHFVTYILALKPRKEGELMGTENGILLHGVLERLFKDLKAGRIADAEEAARMAGIYFDEELKKYGFEELAAKPKIARQFARVKEEGARICTKLFEIYSRSDFKPLLIEGRIEDFAKIEVSFGERACVLEGKIDRVDVYGDRFIIIDYKSFKSADLSLDDVYFGKKLQLYIYMYAVEKGLGLRPAGVFYLPIYDGYTDSETKLVYKGHASNDEELLTHIDGAAGCEGSVITLARSKRTGELDKNAYMDEAAIERMGEYAFRLAGLGAAQIAEGYIKPSNVKCSPYCCFKDICPYEDICEQRKTGKVSLESFKVEGDSGSEGCAEGKDEL